MEVWLVLIGIIGAVVWAVSVELRLTFRRQRIESLRSEKPIDDDGRDLDRWE